MWVAVEVGDPLCTPQHVVAVVEAHGDRGGDCHRKGGGGGGGRRHLPIWL
jgi:hypothetical protein